MILEPLPETARPIRLAIDARPFSGSPCGYTIYLSSVLSCLRDSGLEITLLSNKGLMPIYPEVERLPAEVFGSPGDLRWEQVNLPEYLAVNHYDLYFSGANRGIPYKKSIQTRYILGLLDIIPYLFFRSYFIHRFWHWISSPHLNRETFAQLISIIRADAILTISQQSAQDIRRVFHRHNVRVCTIRLPENAQKYSEPPESQFVYVGGVDIRKKVDILLRAFALFIANHPEHKLVLVGSNYSTFLSLITQLGVQDNVVFTGYVDHDTKFRILGRSLAMVYPSLYEGYGLAIAEGFQADIPVIAGSGGSQAEIGGQGTRRIDPTSPHDIAAAMEEMLDPTIRSGWILRGREQLKRLTAPSIERGTVDFFLEQAELARRTL